MLEDDAAARGCDALRLRNGSWVLTMTGLWARALQGVLAGLNEGRSRMMAGWGGTSLNISPDEFPDPDVDLAPAAGETEQSIILAGGCFWCIEAVYTEVEGVLGLVSGYAGG